MKGPDPNPEPDCEEAVVFALDGVKLKVLELDVEIGGAEVIIDVVTAFSNELAPET